MSSSQPAATPGWLYAMPRSPTATKPLNQSRPLRRSQTKAQKREAQDEPIATPNARTGKRRADGVFKRRKVLVEYTNETSPPPPQQQQQVDDVECKVPGAAFSPVSSQGPQISSPNATQLLTRARPFTRNQLRARRPETKIIPITTLKSKIGKRRATKQSSKNVDKCRKALKESTGETSPQQQQQETEDAEYNVPAEETTSVSSQTSCLSLHKGPLIEESNIQHRDNSEENRSHEEPSTQQDECPEDTDDLAQYGWPCGDNYNIIDDANESSPQQQQQEIEGAECNVPAADAAPIDSQVSCLLPSEEPPNEETSIQQQNECLEENDADALAKYGWPCGDNYDVGGDENILPSALSSSPLDAPPSSFLTEKPTCRSILNDLLHSNEITPQRDEDLDRKSLFEAVLEGDFGDIFEQQDERPHEQKQSTSRLYHHDDAIDAFFSCSNLEDNISTERLSSSTLRKGQYNMDFLKNKVRPGFLALQPRFLTAEYFRENGPRSCAKDEEEIGNTTAFALRPYFESKFTIIERLGSGEYADVYKVFDQETSSLSAVKKTKLPFRSYDDRWQQIIEADHMRAVSHSKHCIQLLDAWEQAGYLYMQMELCSYGSLRGYITMQNGKVPEDMIWHILYEIAMGLKDIHDADILHLDLKPSNILLDESGYVKIGDFGTSVREPVNHRWVKGEGDRRYMAPDLLRDQFHKPADIFSLGLIILEMAAAIELPGTGESWEQLRLGDFSDYEEALARTSSDMQDLVKWLLSANSKERPTVDQILAHPRVVPRPNVEEGQGVLFDYVQHLETIRADESSQRDNLYCTPEHRDSPGYPFQPNAVSSPFV